MMEGLISNEKGTFNVHLSGGSPWGFTLHGGSEFNSKLYIKRVSLASTIASALCCGSSTVKILEIAESFAYN